MSYVDLGLCSVVAFLSVAAATIVCCRHVTSGNPPHYYSIAPLHASAAQASAAQASAAQASAAQAQAHASAVQAQAHASAVQAQAHASAVQAQAHAQAHVVIVDAPKYESYQNCPPMYEECVKPHI
jgi:hypothetical protein